MTTPRDGRVKRRAAMVPHAPDVAVRRGYAVHRAAGWSFVDGPDGSAALAEVPRFADPNAAAHAGSLLAPMPGGVVRVLAPVPKIALYPAFILILGFEHASKIALVASDALFPILLATYQGTSAVEPKLVWSALAAGTSRRRALFTIVLPAALPSVLTGCRIGLVISCIVVFLAEMITSSDGLGHVLVTAARTFQAVDMFVPLITISLLGLILNGLLGAVRAYLLRGFPEA